MLVDTVPASGPKAIVAGPLPLVNANVITLINAADLVTVKLTVCF
mgnify:CR=1 FL=1